MNDYPVVFTITRPERFDRLQILLRLVLLVIFSIVGTTLGAIAALLYLLLPVSAAVFISQKGGRSYVDHAAPRITSILRFVLGVYAYFALLTDKLPTGGSDDPVQFAVYPTGSPTVGSALGRFVTSLPAAFMLALFGIAAWFVWIVAAIMIVIDGRYPLGLFDFQCGVFRWQARLLAYHASLVDAYPPLTLSPGASSPTPTLP